MVDSWHTSAQAGACPHSPSLPRRSRSRFHLLLPTDLNCRRCLAILLLQDSSAPIRCSTIPWYLPPAIIVLSWGPNRSTSCRRLAMDADHILHVIAIRETRIIALRDSRKEAFAERDVEPHQPRIWAYNAGFVIQSPANIDIVHQRTTNANHQLHLRLMRVVRQHSDLILVIRQVQLQLCWNARLVRVRTAGIQRGISQIVEVVLASQLCGNSLFAHIEI